MLFILILTSCSGGTYLKTEWATPAEMTGTYTVFLYGGGYIDDLTQVAVLVKEGGPYTVEIYAPDSFYKTKSGLSPKQALEESAKFVNFHSQFMQAGLSRIIDTDGSTIGYEVRPYYDPLALGTSDVIDVAYLIKDRKVQVNIRLKPEIERMFMSDNDGH